MYLQTLYLYSIRRTGSKMKGHQKDRAQASRSITYSIDVGYDNYGFDEAAVEKLLEKARAEGLVTEFDCGRGHCCWFQGKPGAPLRELKKIIQKVIDATFREYEK